MRLVIATALLIGACGNKADSTGGGSAAPPPAPATCPAGSLVKDGAGLKCGTCHRVYPIKDDIPVMLIDEATVEA